MYIAKLTLHELRCFREAKIGLLHPDLPEDGSAVLRNVNLLLGNNGAGKTTVLKALALGTLAPIVEASGYVPYRLIRRGPSGAIGRATIGADVVLHAQDLGGERLEERITSRLQTSVFVQGDYEIIRSHLKKKPSLLARMFDDDSPAFLVVGYGATRRVEAADRFDTAAQSKRRRLRYQRVAGLFEDHIALTPLSSWLPRLGAEHPDRFSQVRWLLNELLGDHAHFSGEQEGEEYVFEHLGTRVPFPALSDGYRSYIGWIADLLYHICMGCPPGMKLADSRGLVLVDEIDLHLHPEWQRTVVPLLGRVLPRLQFVFSTHSPIVAGTLHAENIIVMETDAEGASTPRRFHERIYGLNADQVLLSSYFSLSSTRAPGALAELVKLSRKARGGDAGAVLSFMRKLAGEAETSSAAEARPRPDAPRKAPKPRIGVASKKRGPSTGRRVELKPSERKRKALP